jgi:Cu+-exporting ATPase
VAEAQAGKAPVQRLVDRISAVFVLIVIAISLGTLAGWLLLTGSRRPRPRRPWPC